MDRAHIISDLAGRTRLPWDALEYCLGRRGRSSTIFLALLNRLASGGSLSADEESALYYGLLVLAYHQRSAALLDLLKLLECRREETDRLLGDGAIGEVLPRVLMAIGENHTDDLWSFAMNAPADWLIRDAVLKAWVYFALTGTVPRETARKHLEAFPDAAGLSPEDPFWISWMNAIADLGLTALRPLMNASVENGQIERGPLGLSEADYRDILARLEESSASLRKSVSWRQRAGYTPFGEEDRVKYDFYNAARLAPGTSQSVSQTLMMQAAEDAANQPYRIDQAGNENTPA